MKSRQTRLHREDPREGAMGGLPTPRGPRNGIILIVVTVAILMVSLAGLTFVSMMATENKAAHVHGDELRLSALTGSGGQLLDALLEQPPEVRWKAGGLTDNPDLFRGAPVFEDQQAGRRGRFSVVSPRVENGEITGMRFGAENESARLNLAVLPQWELKHPGAAREALLNLPGMTDSIADAILDWIDADDAQRQFGAEADFYAGLGVPYAPRNGAASSLEELLLVRGVTRELLFGADVNFNHYLEAEETKTAGERLGRLQSAARLTWASLLTVHSAERNVSHQGVPRIDLNHPDMARLHRRLREVFEEEWVRFIILYRQFGPYEADDAASPADSAGQPVAATEPESPSAARDYAPVEPLDLSKPGKFPLASVLDLVGAKVKLPEKPASSDSANSSADAVTTGITGEITNGTTNGSPPILESPFADEPASMREYLPKLLDHATVDKSKVIRGRINVNEAPRAVLLGVPGLDGAVVEQIVTARGRAAALDDPSRRHATWLLTEGLVDLARMKDLMPHLTAAGDVYRAQIVAYFDTPGPSDRVEVVIDGTWSPPRRVYWKSLRLLGRGYPLEFLGAAATDGEAPASPATSRNTGSSR